MYSKPLIVNSYEIKTPTFLKRFDISFSSTSISKSSLRLSIDSQSIFFAISVDKAIGSS